MDKFEQAAAGQLEAYNNGDIEGFLKWYTDDVVAIDMDTGRVILKGLKEMRERYSIRFENKDLHAELKNRMVLHRTVIDHEVIQIDESDKRYEAIAIYDIEESGLIGTVRFTKGKL